MYCDEPSVMGRSDELLFCTLETNIHLYVNYSGIKSKINLINLK